MLPRLLIYILTLSKAHRLTQIFDRRAHTFSEVDFLPREIAQRMRERLDYIALTPARVLDAGCGSGQDLAALQARFPSAKIIGVDISHGMLAKRFSAQRTRILSKKSILNVLKIFRNAYHWLTKTQTKAYVVQGDFSSLPFAPSSFDMLWSNLALPWQAPFTEAPKKADSADASAVHPLVRLFSEWQRALNPNGLLMFSTLGPDSLQELRHAWAQVDKAYPRARVLDFIDMHDIGDMLVHSGFENPVMDVEKITLTYRSAEALLKDVRRWGAYPAFPMSNTALKRPEGLMGKSTYKALLAALKAQQSQDGTIALTFEIVYGHAWRPALTKDSNKRHMSSGDYAPMQFHPSHNASLKL